MLQKFLGADHGLRLTAILGGLVSTTASTTAFARMAKEDPASVRTASEAAVLSNAVQAPRVLAILIAASPALALASLPVLAAVTLAGVGWAWIAGRRASGVSEKLEMGVKNPFSLVHALKFGVLFALIRLLSRALSEEYGSEGVLWASGIGGSADADSVVFAVSGLFREARIETGVAVWGVLLALSANALLKTFLAYSGGGKRFGTAVALAFVVMFAAGATALAARAWW
jgi:uncharacterized membrane protein (DUF4010 family)